MLVPGPNFSSTAPADCCSLDSVQACEKWLELSLLQLRICMLASQSDKLLTVCDILTVSKLGAAAAANTFNPPRLKASQTSKTALFTSKREERKNVKRQTCQGRQTLMLASWSKNRWRLCAAEEETWLGFLRAAPQQSVVD